MKRAFIPLEFITPTPVLTENVGTGPELRPDERLRRSSRSPDRIVGKRGNFKKNKPRDLSRGGFTLAELVLVIFVVAIVSTALLGTFVTCLALNENSRMTTVAMNLARDIMEEAIKNPDWSLIVSGHYVSGDLLFYGSYNVSCQVSVKNFPNDSSPTLKFVRVAVCWRLKNGRVVGSDANLNGEVDTGEATESWPPNLPAGQMPVFTSPVVVATAILKSS